MREFGRQRRRGQTLLRVVPCCARPPLFAVELVTDDMPFLVDTQSMLIDRAGLAVRVIAHPILRVVRDPRGNLRSIADATATSPRALRESWQRILIDPPADENTRAQLEATLRDALADVRIAFTDWQAMRAALRRALAYIDATPPPLPRAIVKESKDFLQWMASSHFTFLGFRQSKLVKRGKRLSLEGVPGSELGILRRRRTPQDTRGDAIRPADIQREIAAKNLLLITKGNALSTVHRPDHLDYVGIKRFDKRGRLIGEWRFLGLWTSVVFRESPQQVPMLRQKLQRVIAHFAFDAASHDGKRLQQIVETYPREELLQASAQELTAAIAAILDLQEHRQVLLLARRDAFHRFHNCLVFVPRDHYDERVLANIRSILLESFGGYRVTVQVDVFESSFVRVYLMVRVDPAARDREVDLAVVEQRIADATVTWRDALQTALLRTREATQAIALANHYATQLPPVYLEEVAPAAALRDIAELEALDESPLPRLHLARAPGAPPQLLQLRAIRRGHSIPISDVVPVLENFGLRVLSERSYELPSLRASIQQLDIESVVQVDLDADAPRFIAALSDVLAARSESDGFNRLVLIAQLSARDVTVLRAYCNFLLQTGLPFSQVYMERVLAANFAIARNLVRLFEMRLDPAQANGRHRNPSAPQAATLLKRINAALEQVKSLDEDRILRAFLNVVLATLRTNLWSPRVPDAAGPVLSFKFDAARIPELPQPVPHREIFVHGLRVQGVHLRMGAVARGGIRWSDRREDFRTEVLGLLKAQHVKNSLIVPVGAKGGFFVRRMPQGISREAQQQEAIACYCAFIRGLLDLTDNIVNGRVQGPPGVVRLDADDPYLVVAADKGTATFSDIANAIAAEYSFWLSDAFASGGSAGYDHKKMGITARGAWECVKRHFREIGADIQREDFTVLGIGDMSGDVFGNGMLLSKHIRLQAAFNHLHIFLDPVPVAATSFRERKRLAKLPRSGWNDYDRKLISRGGGIYERSVKAIPLSGEVRAMLGINDAALPPNELIRALLRMKVDLLFNGGIGTYAKAASESPLQVGDRSNDPVRVEGRELGAKVVGEGGNLGFTQRGRIEYAARGGRLNTDSIDNSAGVNTSDVEVNYKILLATATRSGLTTKARNTLLASVTEVVAAQVLRNNYLQSQAVSVLERESTRRLSEYQLLLRSLAQSDGLSRSLEQLPADDELADRIRQGKGLLRPELAVVLSWGKLSLNRDLLASTLPDDPHFALELQRYFAPPLLKRAGKALLRHPLRREIIATATSNSLINRMGPAFVAVTQAQTGATPQQIARAYSIARDATGMRKLWDQIEALDSQVAATAQYDAMEITSGLLRQLTYWLLRHRRAQLDVRLSVAEFGAPTLRLARTRDWLAGAALERYEARHAAQLKAGFPASTAALVAACPALDCSFDLCELARASRQPIDAIAALYADLAAALGLDWLRLRVEDLPQGNTWHNAARAGLRDTVRTMQRRVTEQALRLRNRDRVTAWLAAHSELDEWQTLLKRLRSAPALDFAALSVGSETLRRLISR
ncbi:MAG: NAD-glutamate dehydrogenase [Steroidobacteraceae bacterium]